MPETAWQTCRVDKNPEKTLAANLRWLHDETEFDSQAKIATAAGVDQKTIGRMMNMDHSPTLDKICAVAAFLKIEAWQLLAPDFGAGYYRIKGDQIVTVARPTVQIKQTKRTGTHGP